MLRRCLSFSLMKRLLSFLHFFLTWIAPHSAYLQDGYSALIVASRNGHTDTVQLLVQTGADKEARNYVREREREREDHTGTHVYAWRSAVGHIMCGGGAMASPPWVSFMGCSSCAQAPWVTREQFKRCQLQEGYLYSCLMWHLFLG